MLKMYGFVPVLVAALLWGCGKKEEQAPAAEAPAATAPATEAPAAAPAETTQVAAGGDALGRGADIYKKSCAMCHQTGAAGAPLIGNKADWEARIAQGKDVLYEHAIKGFTGSKGSMPAKGGNASLSDGDVRVTVDYMVAQAK